VKNYFYILRPQQWIKNLFVLLPLVFANRLFDFSALLTDVIAFFCFCGVASSVYVLNDIVDLSADKIHPTKKLRPMAAGKVPLSSAALIAVLLFSVSIYVACLLQLQFGFVLGVYFMINVVYSLWLKQLVIIDVMCIGIFYVLRVIAGAVVIQVEISHWLIICTAVLALFIGFNKRRHELKVMGRHSARHRTVLENYSQYFIDQMIGVLTASTVIFYTLYTVDRRTVELFGSTSLLYTVPFVYYGVFRYLYLVHKRGKGGDPTRVVLTDSKMIVNILLWAVTAVTIIYFRL